jgi:hypothetical protein
MTESKVKLACGDIYVVGYCWRDLGCVSSFPTVRVADLLAKLPLAMKGLAAEQPHVTAQHIQCAQVSAAMLLQGGRHG